MFSETLWMEDLSSIPTIRALDQLAMGMTDNDSVESLDALESSPFPSSTPSRNSGLSRRLLSFVLAAIVGSSSANCTAGRLALRRLPRGHTAAVVDSLGREIDTLTVDRDNLTDMLVEEMRAREDVESQLAVLDAECAALRIALALSEAQDQASYNEQLAALQREKDAFLSAHATHLQGMSAQLAQTTWELEEAQRCAVSYQMEANFHKDQCFELSSRLREVTDDYASASDVAANQSMQLADLQEEVDQLNAAQAKFEEDRRRFAQEKDELLRAQKELEHQLDDLRSQNATLATQNENLAREITSTRSALAHTDATNRDLTAHAESLQRSVEESEQRAAESIRRVEASETQLVMQKERSETLAVQLEEQVVVTSSAEARVQELETVVQEKGTAITGLQAKCTQVQEQAAAELSAKHHEVLELRTENVLLQSAVTGLTIQATVLSNLRDPDTVDSLRVQLRSDNFTKNEEIGKLQEEVKSALEAVQQACNDKESEEKQRKQLQTSNETLEKAVANTQKQLRESEGLINELASVVKRQNDELEQLRERLATQEILQDPEATLWNDSTGDASMSSGPSSPTSSSSPVASATLRALRQQVASLRQHNEILQSLLAVRSSDLAKPKKSSTTSSSSSSPEKENQEKQSQRRSWSDFFTRKPLAPFATNL